MTPGQTRVLVLLVVLLAMEAVIHPGIKQWVATALNGFNASLNKTGTKQ